MRNRHNFFRTALAVLLMLGLSAPATAEIGQTKDAGKAAAKPINIGSRLELLVDNYLVERMSESTVLRLHHPVRREAIMKFDRPWEGNACGYFTVIQDGDLYRMYYRGSNAAVPSIKSAGNYHTEVTCYIESRDGIHWTRPDLGIKAYIDGSKKNNIILTSYMSFDKEKGQDISHNFTPFLDKNPDCKPSEKFKALGGVFGGLFALKSADGVHWTLLSEKPVILEGPYDGQNTVFWDSLRKRYVVYTRGWHGDPADSKGQRDVLMRASKDFHNWSESTWLEYTPGRITQLYTNQIEPYYRAPRLYVGFPARYIEGRGWFSPINEAISKGDRRCGTDYTDTGFITSRDGKTFNVWPEAFVRPGPSPELWMYGVGYTAWGMAETKSNVPGGPNEISFYISDAGYWTGPGVSYCRYTLRRDGFVSATAPLSGGSLLTKPILFDGNQLKINFETSAAGSLQIEIQDVQGEPIPGFTLAECPSLFGNATDYAVEWKSKAKLSDLAGKPVRLRFVLKDADLYAFRFGEK